MGLILNIETAVDNSSVCLARNGELVAQKEQPEPKETASWIQSAIQDLLKENQIDFNALHAVAVSAGPGSYTGLRVGMATAKGFCYALNIPLITLNTLKIIAGSVEHSDGLICPMIDARRMEVFTAVYDKNLAEVLHPTNMILNDQSFLEMLNEQKITFCGNGSSKFQHVSGHKNAAFAVLQLSAYTMVPQSEKAFKMGQFADLAYVEPIYGKEFFSPSFKPFE